MGLRGHPRWSYCSSDDEPDLLLPLTLPSHAFVGFITFIKELLLFQGVSGYTDHYRPSLVPLPPSPIYLVLLHLLFRVQEGMG